MSNLKLHWEKIYATKQANEVSWTQEVPESSIQLFESLQLPKDANIIDVGGGDSKFVDYLISNGFENITVLDISAIALEKAQNRLGKNATKINWIVSDILDFKPTTKYDCWHDRATFHFLINKNDIHQYVDTINHAVNKYIIMGTFSTHGPKKCSNLDIHQYNEIELETLLQDNFNKLYCTTVDHITPFDTIQNFLFCSFIKKKLKYLI